MAIDLEKDDLLPLSLACDLVPVSTRTGKPLHASALYRWSRVGLLGSNGSRVYLEVARAGSTLVTTRRAILDFFRRLNPPGDTARERLSDNTPLPPSDGREAQTAAARELDAAGI